MHIPLPLRTLALRAPDSVPPALLLTVDGHGLALNHRPVELLVLERELEASPSTVTWWCTGPSSDHFRDRKPKPPVFG